MTKEKIFGKQGFFAKIGKRNLLIIGAVLLIGVAVYLNYVWFYNPTGDLGYGDNNMENQYGDSAGTSVPSTAETYFTSAQLSREKARDEALEVLQTVVNSEDALQETKDAALSDISRIALDMEQEANIESLVIAKGFSNCVAVKNGDSVSVIVESDGLLPSQVAQIKEIVYEQTGVAPVSVKIIEKATNS
ncbi:MAG: SpoIIIAH-like family protein [Clostridia bacterium]|nr:SpoIIIAH-like family protein [Clostridia bacterium]